MYNVGKVASTLFGYLMLCVCVRKKEVLRSGFEAARVGLCAESSK